MRVRTEQSASGRLPATTPFILGVGLDYPLCQGEENLRILEVDSKQEALQLLAKESASVLVLGPRLDPHAACEILSQYQIAHPAACTANIVLGCGSSLDPFQTFVDEDQLFYLSRGPLPNAQVRSLVLAGVQRFHSKQKAIRDGVDAMVAPADRVLEFCTRLSFQSDLATAGDLLLEAVQILINADRSHYLIYEEEIETLWAARVGGHAQERRESACAGLLGYVARTGEQVCVKRSGEDSRYDAETDDPGGVSDARLLAEPMFGNGGKVIAVVTAIRGGQMEPFSEDDVATLKLLTACAASAISGMLLQRRIRALLLEQVQPTLDRANVFREEALQYYAAEQNEEGEVLHTSPSWLKQTHWLTIALLLLGFLWMILAKVHEKADGLAVVKAVHKMTPSASSAGMIRSVVVAQGDHVRAGDLLVQFYDTTGATNLERVKQEVRSPSDGVVSDIRVRAGQVVNAGDQMATVVDEAGGYELVAFFPGYYAPQLHPGMKIVLKVSGYPESHETFVIDHVGAEIIGPHEAEQYAGKESSDAALQVSGPAVSVRARVSARAFKAGDDSYVFYDGMTGETEVIVHSEPLLVYLFPGLKQIRRWIP
jgi:membrane fusion protein, multidrug efflux system